METLINIQHIKTVKLSDFFKRFLKYEGFNLNKIDYLEIRYYKTDDNCLSQSITVINKI